ncbi:MAG: EAL domain-containing protein [Gallionella sp.]|nr:EAL domain-containing protein [Gallionella sp.]
MSFHPLLLRQLRKAGWSEGSPPLSPEQWNELLSRISRTYSEADQERYLLNRSQELAFRETEDVCLRLSEAQHIAGLGNWFFDLQHNTGQWSDGCLRIFNSSGSSLTPSYSDFINCIYDSDRQKFISAVDIALQNGRSFEIELRIPYGNNGVRWVHTNVQPASNSTGSASKIHGTVMDITERKHAEEALRDSEFNLRQAQEVSHMGSWALDTNFRMTWSDEMYRILGVSPETFMPDINSLMSLLLDDDQTFMQSWLENCFAGKSPDALFFRAIRPDGEVRKIEGQVALLRDANGMHHHLSGTFQDITERKRVEHELQLAKFVLDNAPINITYLNEDARICYINKTSCETLGYTQEELLQMDIPDIDPLFPMDVWAAHWQDLKNKISVPVVTQHRRKNGEIFPVEVIANYVKFGDKEYNVAFDWDISERKKIETDLRVAATAFELQVSMIITDANGVILRVNQEFTRNTGYAAEDVIGKTPSILKSGRHDAAFYAAMWESIHQDGTWHGEIWDRRKNGEIFPKWLTISAVKGKDGAVTHYVGSHVDIAERKRSEEEIKELAYFDPLTRLPNRRLLRDRLEHALASSVRSGREAVLLFIDLDNFKTLNDTLGHNVGDLLLQQVAQRLLSCVRDCDTVARLGGDEFVVILEDLGSQSLEAAKKAEAVGEIILYSLGQPYFIASQECRSTPSIGATLFNGNHQQIDELLKQADIAMYQAKAAGRNTLRFFNPEMQESINVRSALEGELRTAIEQQQFQLYYQIQVDGSHRPLGAEALIRWVHPERGTILPLRFIPLAEEIGLILPIGQWVMETACAQLKAWEQDVLTRNLSLSLNVSAKQFHQECFASQVQETIQRHGINPELLKLELTESMLVEDIEKTIYCMKTLNEIGIRFSLDDFGTGYSSLQYLKRLPLEQLKIDQSFVKDIAIDDNDKAIINTIIAMAHSMGINVIAEGVETQAQRQQLLQSKCNQFQGYLFSKPVPIEQFNVHLLTRA